jgi:hypothetical protein
VHRWLLGFTPGGYLLVCLTIQLTQFIAKSLDLGADIRCYAQDPAFTPLDKDFLALLNIQVLDSNLESKITSNSFVYSPFVDWFLLLPTFLKDKSPVLYIGNEILDDYSPYAQTTEKKERLDECNEIGRKWLEGREMVRLGEFEMHANALNGMVVYWEEKREEEEDRSKKVVEGEKEKDVEGTKELAYERG